MTSAKTKLLTDDDLLRLHSQGVKGELIRGVFCETVSMGIEHGEIAFNLGGEIRAFVRPRRLGRVVGSDVGIWLANDPDTVREPDLAFIPADRLPLDVRVTGYPEVVPALVAEIVSPSDSLREVHDKARMWLSHGVALVWVVFPDSRTVDVHQNGSPVATLAEDDSLDGGTVLPGFSLPVREVFE